MPENVTLRGPGGDVWSVELTATNGTLHFTQGWETFVRDHCLEENDLLIFKYNNESQFEVLIFGHGSSCEKAAAYFVRKCGHPNKRIKYKSLEEVNFPSNIHAVHASPEKIVRGESIGVPPTIPSDKDAHDTDVEFPSPLTAIPLAGTDLQGTGLQTSQRVGTRGSKAPESMAIANLIAGNSFTGSKPVCCPIFVLFS